MSAEPTNAQRAERARKTLAFYAALLADGSTREVENGNYRQPVQDFLTDVLHAAADGSVTEEEPWTDETFAEISETAFIDYENETSGEQIVKLADNLPTKTCEGCIHRHYVKADPFGSSTSGWGCRWTGGHAVARCGGYKEAV